LARGQKLGRQRDREERVLAGGIHAQRSGHATGVIQQCGGNTAMKNPMAVKVLRTQIKKAAPVGRIGYVDDISDQGLGAGLVPDQLAFIRLLQGQ